MDIITVSAYIIGAVLIFTGMMGYPFSFKNLIPFWSVSSIFITIGGTLATAFISHPFSLIRNLLKIWGVAIKKSSYSPVESIEILVSFAEKARREGLLALEDDVLELSDTFIQKGIQLVVDGTDPEMVKNILITEMSSLEERHTTSKEIFEHMASLAPAFGMIGTLIGLVIMLRYLNDPSSIGPSMGTALVTTFYGAVLANLFFTPTAHRLGILHAEELLQKSVILEGILAIQSGDNPRLVEEKLNSFLRRGEGLTRSSKEE